MRGADKRSGELFSYVDLEERVRANHPPRAIRSIASEALEALSGEFAVLYSGMGRPSIAPEMLLRAMLLQAFYSVRSERQLMERLEYDLLFRWFVGLGVDEPVWDHSTFSKNRDRLLDGDVAARFLSAILAQPRVRRLLSSDHFSVDGTLIEAWASMKSFRQRDEPDRPAGGDGGRNPTVDFRAEKRSHATHASTTDPDAMLYRKPVLSGWLASQSKGDRGWRPGSASSATASWRTGRACWSMPGSRACPGTPSALPRWR